VMQSSIDVGIVIDGRKIAVVGSRTDFRFGDHLLPVQFDNGEYAILAWDAYRPPKPWVIDDDTIVQAIKKSIAMPVVYRSAKKDAFGLCGLTTFGCAPNTFTMYWVGVREDRMKSFPSPKEKLR